MLRLPVVLLVATTLALSASPQPRYRLISLRDAGGALGSGINSRGDVVGRAVEGGNPRSFLLRDGVFTILPDLTPNYRNSTAIAINEVGEVVGMSYAPTAPPFPGYSSHAFYWSADTGIINLTPDIGGLSIANAVNNHGEAVGYVMQGAQSGAMLWRVRRDGSVGAERVTPASEWSANAYDINDRGLVTGSRVDPEANALVPFVYDARSGKLTPLPMPQRHGEALAINNADQIAGFVIDERNAHRVTIWSRGGGGQWEATDFGYMPYPHVYCKPYAINSHRQLVGTCLAEGAVPPEAWVLIDGRLTRIEDVVAPEVAARWQFLEAYDVNDSGVIVGAGTEDGQAAAFMLVPMSPPKRRAVRK